MENRVNSGKPSVIFWPGNPEPSLLKAGRKTGRQEGAETRVRGANPISTPRAPGTLANEVIRVEGDEIVQGAGKLAQTRILWSLVRAQHDLPSRNVLFSAQPQAVAGLMGLGYLAQGPSFGTSDANALAAKAQRVQSTLIQRAQASSPSKY